LPEALAMARERDLDLVEVAPQANPPVCRIMDYGKFRYEESQKLKESRKKATHISIKEVKFRPKIGKGDFDTKVRHMFDFLNEGHKVKVTLQFRGREMAHPELGSKILDQVLAQIGPLGKVEASARLEGRNMTMVLSPDKKAAELAAKKAAEEAAEAAEAEAARAAAAGATAAPEPVGVASDPAPADPAPADPAGADQPTDPA
jgi:translation initiation factor IF-3